jgi:hypothetical protein
MEEKIQLLIEMNELKLITLKEELLNDIDNNLVCLKNEIFIYENILSELKNLIENN